MITDLLRPFVETFILSIIVPGQRNQRRQGGSFVGGSGGSTSTCDTAVIYMLRNGQMFANSGGTASQFSCNSSDTYAAFVPSATPGSITTTFSIDNQGNLLWANESFFNSGALFCIAPDSTIYAVFQSGAQPGGCVFIALNLVRSKLLLWPLIRSDCSSIKLRQCGGINGYVHRCALNLGITNLAL